MLYLVSEKKLGLAALIFSLGIYLFMQAALFAQPVSVSEKGLLALIGSTALILSSIFFAFRSIKKVR